MEFSSLRSFFNYKLAELQLSTPISAQISFQLSALHKRIIRKFPSKPLTSKSITGLIENLQSKEKVIEKNLREKKLKAAIQVKKELENRLLFISKSIGDIQEEKNKKKTQKELFCEAQKKGEEFVQEIKKFSELNKKSEAFLKIQSEKLKRKARVLEEQDLILAEKMKEKRRMEREAELEKLRQKKEIRVKEMEESKRMQSTTPIFHEIKPLYVKLEENFKRNIEMPELEKRKEELKKKSMISRSVQFDSLKQHEKWYNSIKQANLIKQKNEKKDKYLDSQIRATSMTPSIWTMKVLEETKNAEAEKIKKIEEKKKLLENKIRFGEMLKELYRPAQSALKPIPVDDKFDKTAKQGKKRLVGSASLNSKEWKPHKFNANPMVPPPKPQREPKQILYLEERRNERTDSPENIKKLEEDLANGLNDGIIDKRTMKKMHKTANKLEELARKKEMMLENKPLSVSLIHQNASVDKIIVSSIKAKLQLLENF